MTSQAPLSKDPTKLPDFQPGRVQRNLDAAELKSVQASGAYKPPHLAVAERLTSTAGLAGKPEIKSSVGSQGKPLQLQTVQYPYTTIGKIFTGGSSGPIGEGVGVVIQPDLLLTAGHTVPWDTPGWYMQFVPAYDNGNEPLGYSFVSEAHGWNVSGKPAAANDLAICKLYSPLGQTTTGWIGSLSFQADSGYTGFANPIQIVGYIEGNDNSTETSGYPVGSVQDFGDFKLLDMGEVFPTFNDATTLTYYGEEPVTIGILSGLNGSDTPLFGDTAFAGGPGLVNLVLWGSANFG